MSRSAFQSLRGLSLSDHIRSLDKSLYSLSRVGLGKVKDPSRKNGFRAQQTISFPDAQLDSCQVFGCLWVVNCGSSWINVENATSKVGTLIKTTELGTDMFRGLHEHNLDAKGRVSMPVRFRELLSPEKDASVSLFSRLASRNVWSFILKMCGWSLNQKLAALSQFDPPWFRFVASIWPALLSALSTSMDGS